MRFSRFNFLFLSWLLWVFFLFVCVLHLFLFGFLSWRDVWYVIWHVWMRMDGLVIVMEYGRRADIPSINQFSDNVYKNSYINEIT